MSNTANRRATRAAGAAETALPPEKSSEQLREELARLDADRAANIEKLDRLDDERTAVLLTDDDAKAEQHDAEAQRTRRAIERADLKRPAAVEAIAAAEERERLEARAIQQAEARSKVQAVLKRLDDEYGAPAKQIAAFLADWKEASEAARKADVDGPDTLAREQAPQLISEAGEDVHLVYIDEQGNDTDVPFPPGSYEADPEGKPIVKHRRQARRTTPRPAKYSDGIYPGPLAGHVNLPQARAGQQIIWNGESLEVKGYKAPLARYI